MLRASSPEPDDRERPYLGIAQASALDTPGASVKKSARRRAAFRGRPVFSHPALIGFGARIDRFGIADCA